MKRLFGLVLTILLLLSISACSSGIDNQASEETPKEEIEVNQQGKPTEDEPITEELSPQEPAAEKSMVDDFIEKYNATATTPITDAVEVDVTDETSGHYRTEFRLGAFEDSVAKTGKVGDVIIDIVNCGWQKDELRIYADDVTREQASEIIKFAAPILDPDVPNDELQDVLDYLMGINDYHNGYFGNLCMTFNEIRGELMLRTD